MLTFGVKTIADTGLNRFEILNLWKVRRGIIMVCGSSVK